MDAFELNLKRAGQLMTELAGTRWQHFKKLGTDQGFYQIIGFGVSANTGEVEVEYSPIVEGTVRPLCRVHRNWDEWNETVDRGDYQGPRFVPVSVRYSDKVGS